ncbi:MAG: hypothetical protein RML56_06860 [Burkholderiales bacterium]|nr:hypothetical protein [Burkholderiales bacterium]MDW8468733.1 hypothetical protein [Burkholderiales bacterium]
MIKVALALVVLGAAVWLAHLHVAAQSYHPSVRVRLPENVHLVMTHAPVDRHEQCAAITRRFVEPMRRLCTECRIEHARCERTPAPDRGATHYTVRLREMQIAVEGAPERARGVCEEVAVALVRNGAGSAACVFPRPKPGVRDSRPG